jgi:MscS family membrane protein
MKLKFETCFRGLLVFLLLIWLGGIWAIAQPSNQPTRAPTATSSAAAARSQQRTPEHSLTFGLDRIPLLSETHFLGQPLWKYAASLLYLFLAFLLARFIDWVTCVWLRRLTARTQTRLDDLLLELLHGPIKVVAFVILLHMGLNFFDWPERIQTYLSKGLVLVVAGSLTYVGVKLVNMLLDVWRQRHGDEKDRKFNDQLFAVIRKSLNGFLIVVAVLVTAQNLGINITAAITSLSIGGLAVGLAAQDTLANLFGGVAVFADRPFHVGDQIKFADVEGVVESVGMRSTRVRNPEGHVVAIPNKTIGNANITNISRRASIKTVMNFALAHDLPGAKVTQALSILEEIYRKHPSTKEAWISFNQFAGRNINIMVVHWWKGTDQEKYLAGIQEMNLAVKERFDAETIRFA